MRLASMLAVVAGLSSCSIHPRPEDYLNVSTYQIVERIRCESREGVLNSIKAYLGSREDRETKAVLARYAQQGRPIEMLDPKDFTGDTGTMLRMFWKTGVAFNFTLDMSETNNLGGELNFLKPLTHSGWNVSAKANLDRLRQNVRTFTVTDDFAGLLGISATACEGNVKGENFIYPMTGKIGVEAMIHAFVYLTLFQNLSGKADKPAGPPTLVDALAFTTTVSGTVTPKVTFAPVGKNFQIADASVTGVVTRTDIHKVVVGLALDPSASGQIGVVRRDVSPRLITVAPRSPAQGAAASAVDHYLLQQSYSPLIILNQ